MILGYVTCFVPCGRDNASGQSMVLPGQVSGDVLLLAIDLLATQDNK